MNGAFILKNEKAIILAIQLGYKNNKQDGQGLAEEFHEVQKRHPDWVEFLGNTEMDSDMLTGELRDKKIKILNLNEERRKNQNGK